MTFGELWAWVVHLWAILEAFIGKALAYSPLIIILAPAVLALYMVITRLIPYVVKWLSHKYIAALPGWSERLKKLWNESLAPHPMPNLIALALFFLSLIIGVPMLHSWLVVSPSLGEKDTLEVANETRKTVAQIIAGLAAFGTFYFTWMRNQLTAQGQITDRFSKAVEQLGSDRISIRMGGIFALERISKDSHDDYWTVMEVLSAFIREHSPAAQDKAEKEKIGKEPTPVLPKDIQAALTVIARRNRLELEKDKSKQIDLRGADLRRAHLHGAKLDRAILTGSLLKSADLSDAQLRGADLNDTILQGANFVNAQLQGADFIRAQLQGADFVNSQLQGARFWVAQLQGADLSEAHLQGANFWRAQLQGAILSGTRLQGANFFDAQLQGADLSKAVLSGACFLDSQILGANFSGCVIGGTITKFKNERDTTDWEIIISAADDFPVHKFVELRLRMAKYRVGAWQDKPPALPPELLNPSEGVEDEFVRLNQELALTDSYIAIAFLNTSLYGQMRNLYDKIRERIKETLIYDPNHPVRREMEAIKWLFSEIEILIKETDK